MKKGNKLGFTLVELLIVVLIIGILTAVAVPQYQIAITKAGFTQMMVAGDALKKAERLYYLQNRKYTQDMTQLGVIKGCTLNPAKTRCTFPDGQECRLEDGGSNVTSYCHWSKGALYYFWRYPTEERWCAVVVSSTRAPRARQVCKSLGGVLDTAKSNSSIEYYKFHQ